MIGCQPEKSKVMYECVKARKIVFEESFETLSDGTAGAVEEGSVSDFVNTSHQLSQAYVVGHFIHCKRLNIYSINFLWFKDNNILVYFIFGGHDIPGLQIVKKI